MDTEEASRVIATQAKLDPADVRVIEGGWDYDTFDVDGEWIFRFPKRDEVVQSLEAELRLLPVLCERLPFAVPKPLHVGDHEGRPFVGYHKIPGRGLRSADGRSVKLCGELGAALTALHSFPVDEACRLLGVEGTVGSWRSRYAALRERFDSDVAPLLDDWVVDAARRGFDEFAGVTFEPALVHNDLGAEHVLIAENRLTGVIDFGDAMVGDPAIDLTGFWIDLGAGPASKIAAACGLASAEAFDRVRFYAWMGAVHAVFYGIDTDDEELVRGAADNIGERMARAE